MQQSQLARSTGPTPVPRRWSGGRHSRRPGHSSRCSTEPPGCSVWPRSWNWRLICRWSTMRRPSSAWLA